MKKTFYTRKIRLIVDSQDFEYKGQVLDTLYKWRYICFKAANQIYTHHYVQQQIRELIYLSDQTKLKLADISKDPDGLLCTSKMNTTYQILARNYKGQIPMHIMSSLNSTLTGQFGKNKPLYLSGERSLSSFKKEIPVPFKGTDVKNLRSCPERKIFYFTLFDIPFKTYLGRDIYDKRAVLQKLAGGEIKLCTSSLVMDKRKIFMLAIFEKENEPQQLDENIIAEANLSLDVPLTVTIGKATYEIGNKDEYLYKRLAIQAAIQRKQRATAFMNKASKKRIRQNTIANLQASERSYVNQKQHVYSKRLIDLCVKNKAATLLLVDQTEKEEQAGKDPFLLRNWGYYGLKEKIERKADKVGIAVLVE
ncbi:MAG TPA: hypothetical protein VGN64_21685 [Dyadobacter sp.]|jgi:hypothetical protein|nr:hypothetical protein [Dyadobacter sp.]